MPSDLLDFGPPADDEAEKAVLASILLNPKIIADVSAALVPDDFRCLDLRDIFAAMLALHAKRVPPDAVLVVGALADAGRFDSNGDRHDRASRGRMERLFDLLPSADHWRFYAQRVKEIANRRRDYYRGITLLGRELEANGGRRPTPHKLSRGKVLS